ncbi:MAG: hypothetical protein LBB62_05120 [Proteiniphilum sp.]|jgi:hypothetical protein|nr:hypothetical protein [Proteiniphilum sp.]
METLVREIHSAFDNASDTLAGKSASVLANNAGAIEAFMKKAERLKALGFTNCADVKKAEQLMKELEVYKTASAYRQKYPFLKFVTREQLDILCGKYRLVYAQVEHYTGSIPLKKQEDIDYWIDKIDPDDIQVYTFKYTLTYMYNHTECTYECTHTTNNPEPLDPYDVRSYAEKRGVLIDYRLGMETEVLSSSDLIIAAPQSQFTGLEKMERKGFGFFARKIEIPDPIVLQPVKGGYLVLAKWGEGADDELLMIPEMN